MRWNPGLLRCTPRCDPRTESGRRAPVRESMVATLDTARGNRVTMNHGNRCPPLSGRVPPGNDNSGHAWRGHRQAGKPFIHRGARRAGWSDPPRTSKWAHSLDWWSTRLITGRSRVRISLGPSRPDLLPKTAQKVAFSESLLSPFFSSCATSADWISTENRITIVNQKGRRCASAVEPVHGSVHCQGKPPPGSAMIQWSPPKEHPPATR